MAGRGSTFTKRQKEQARQQKQRDKAQRKLQRKLDKQAGVSNQDNELEELGEAQAAQFQMGIDEPRRLSDSSPDGTQHNPE